VRSVARSRHASAFTGKFNQKEKVIVSGIVGIITLREAEDDEVNWFVRTLSLTVVAIVTGALLLGGYKDVNSFGFIALLLAGFFGLPGLLLLALLRGLDKRQKERQASQDRF
jgi:uncharacterized membrane protein HdeD (DUF308 family)